MNTKHILLVILLTLSTSILAATESKPRLVVLISVDGLQSNVLSELLPTFEDGGIKKLYTKGEYTFCANTSFQNTGKCAHYASLMSGTTPSNHGIVAEDFFSLLDYEIINALSDNRYGGINTKKNISPKNLLTTTIADELKLQNEASKVFSIALDPSSAIMLGGHIADASIWIDNSSGMLATSHYYEKGLPNWAATVNNEKTIELKSAEMWSPQLDPSSYKRAAITPRTIFGESPIFYMPRSEDNTYEKTRKLKQTPHINNIIKDLAIRALRDEKMGDDDITDLLCVEFSAKTPFDNNTMCAEIEDMYLRLDQNIKYLLDAIDISVGLDNAIIVLTGYHTEPYSPKLLQSKRISSGTFNAKRSMSLLNAYLMAIYGQGKWVSGYNARNIHLNRSLIEENKIKRSEIQEYAAQFMLEFSGVHTAISAYQLPYIGTTDNDNISRMKKSHFKYRSGDVMFTLLPGWYEVDDDGTFIGQASKKQSKFPAFIMGYGIENKKININIEDIIPTLCNKININQPNGCSGDK